CDRYTSASIAYQGYGRGLDLGLIEDLNRRATGGLTPDLTVLLDIDPAAGLSRAASRSSHDRLESAGLEFHQRVRDGFLAQAAGRADWLVIPADGPRERVAEQVWQGIERLLAGRTARVDHASQDA